jgi:hypothetical protein
MQQFRVVCQGTFQVCIDRLFNVAHIGQDRLDACLPQSIVRSLPHPARQHNLAVED